MYYFADANVLGVPADGFVSPVLPQPMIRMLEEDLRQIMAKVYSGPVISRLI